MKTVYKMHDLKTNLSRLVKDIDKGDSIIFGARGKAQYMITSYKPAPYKRGALGVLKNTATHNVEPDLGGWTNEEMEQFYAKDPNLSP